jgi:chemotaxis protein histidine kinase CheA
MSLFEKESHRSGQAADSLRSTASAPASGAASSPLGGFLKRLFPTGDFLDRLSVNHTPKGSERASYFKGRQKVTAPDAFGTRGPNGYNNQRRASVGDRVAATTASAAAASGPSKTICKGKPTPKRATPAKAAAPFRKTSELAEKRKLRVQQREVEQAAFEHSQKSAREQANAARAAEAVEARQERIRQRAEAAGLRGGDVDGDGGATSDGETSSLAGSVMLSSARLRTASQSEEQAAALRRQSEALRQQQAARLKAQEARDVERERERREAAKAKADSKAAKEAEAAQRKAHALREKADERQRRNEEKRERARRIQQEQLQKHQQRAQAIMAKQQRDPLNEWWCDVAMEGCCRPMKGHYEPEMYYCAGDDYMVCASCFEQHLTEDQQVELSAVEPK